MGEYNIVTGVWKTIKNSLLLFWPSIITGVLAFMQALPPEFQAEHAILIGLVTYFIKNYKENR